MVVTDHTESRRLILQIERDVVARSSLRLLLTVADTTVAGHRQELQMASVDTQIQPLIDTAKPAIN